MELRAYSEDLREGVRAAWQEGNTQDGISKTDRISTDPIKRYLTRYKATGSVAATVQSRQARISATDEPPLKALMAREPLAKLERYCAQRESETGSVVSIKTRSRMLVRLGLRQKNGRRRSGAR